MKGFLQKIGATLLASLVLLSTFSFTVNSHYCGEFLVDTAYFGNAEVCEMEMATKASTNKTIAEKKSCCKDVTKFFEAPNFEKQELVKITTKQIKFVAAFAYSYINIYKKTRLKKEFYKDFSPPDIVQNIQVLHQTFLI